MLIWRYCTFVYPPPLLLLMTHHEKTLLKVYYHSPTLTLGGYESAIALLIFGSQYNLLKLHAFLYSYVKYILHFLIRNVTTTVKFLNVFITWVKQLKKNLFISYNWIPCKQYYSQDSSRAVLLPLLYNPTYPAHTTQQHKNLYLLS